jgi:uncharacterized membrane protein
MAATTNVIGFARGQSSTARKLAHSLGWLSAGLGVTEIVAPRAFSKLIGVSQHAPDRLARLGKLAAGATLLAKPQPTFGFWARLAVAALQLAQRRRKPARSSTVRIVATGAAVGGATAVGALIIKKSRAQTLSHRSLRHSASVAVNRPAEECYRYWRDPQKLPMFFKNLKEVHTSSNGRLEWRTRGPDGKDVLRTLELTEDRPGESIAWHSLGDSRITESGSVRFQPMPGGNGTVVRLHVQHEIPSATTRVVRTLLGKDPTLRLRKTLLRFKQIVETGEIATTEGQPAGRSSSTTWLDSLASI